MISSRAVLGFSFAILTTTSVVAEVTITNSFTITNRERDLTFNFPADTADKLVLVMCGEHGFNNDAGALNSVTYDGEPLTEATYRPALTGQTDTLYHGIWYLDNPSTSTGEIVISATTRATVSAFLLTGTAEGHGASDFSGTDTRSIELTTTATDSMVLASFAVGGSGNTGNTNDIDPEGDLIEVSAVKDPSNWHGHVVGSQIVSTPGPNTFSFTGGNEVGGFVAAAEFLSATGVVGGGALIISDISFSPATNEVSLTWPKTGAAAFTVSLSPDLQDWSNEVEAGLNEASDEEPGDVDHITVTLPLPAAFEGSEALFFRVETES